MSYSKKILFLLGFLLIFSVIKYPKHSPTISIEPPTIFQSPSPIPSLQPLVIKNKSASEEIEHVICSESVAVFRNNTFTIPCPKGAVITKKPYSEDITIEPQGYVGYTYASSSMWISADLLQFKIQNMAQFREWFHWAVLKGGKAIGELPKGSCIVELEYSHCNFIDVEGMDYKEGELDGKLTISYTSAGVDGQAMITYILIPQQGRVLGSILTVGYSQRGSDPEQVAAIYHKIMPELDFHL